MIQKSKVKTVTLLENEKNGEYVYDLAVPKYHTFFSNDILVHNTDSIFLYIDPVLKAVLGDDYDVTSNEEKVELVLKIVRKAAVYVNEYVIKRMLECHNTPSEKSQANKYDFNFKEELVIKRGLFMDTKKKYAIWAINKEGQPTDKLTVKGMEIVRSDYPRFSRDMMQDIVEKILRQGLKKTSLIKEVDSYIEKYKTLLLKGSTDAGIPCVWNAREYVKDPRPVKGMQVYNALTGKTRFKPGDKGYRFELERILINRLDDQTRTRLDALIKNGMFKKKIDTIVIPANSELDTKICVVEMDKMLDYAIYNRLQHILDLFGVNVRQTGMVTW